jgi:hypothetical protein
MVTDAKSDHFLERERDRYVSRGLAFVILLNGGAALILVAALAFAPESTSDSHRLAWAMMVFGSGAMAGLLSSLFAYISRILIATPSSWVLVHDLLRVSAIVAAVASGAAFLTALNMVAHAVPEKRTPVTRDSFALVQSERVFVVDTASGSHA